MRESVSVASTGRLRTASTWFSPRGHVLDGQGLRLPGLAPADIYWTVKDCVYLVQPASTWSSPRGHLLDGHGLRLPGPAPADQSLRAQFNVRMLTVLDLSLTVVQLIQV